MHMQSKIITLTVTRLLSNELQYDPYFSTIVALISDDTSFALEVHMHQKHHFII